MKDAYLKNLIKERLGTLHRLVREGRWTKSEHIGVCRVVRGEKSPVDRTGRFRVGAVRLAEALGMLPQELFGVEARTKEPYAAAKSDWRQSKNQPLVRAIQSHEEYPSLRSFCVKNALSNNDNYILGGLLRGSVHPRNLLSGAWRDACIRVAAVLDLPVGQLFPEAIYGPPAQVVALYYGRFVKKAGGAYKNKALNTAILEQYRSVNHMLQVEGMGTRAVDVRKLLRGHLSPKKRNGNWRTSALRLERVLGIPAEVLFPDDVYAQLYRDAELDEAQWAATIPLILYPVRPTCEQELIGCEQELIEEEAVEAALACLDKRARLVLEMRFGLNGHGKHTLVQAGIVLGRTKERVRQLEVKALRKIRERGRGASSAR